MTHVAKDLILTYRSPDQPGIVAAVSTAAFQSGLDIRDAAQFGDSESGQFFLRMHLATTHDGALEKFNAAFKPVAERLSLQWNLAEWTKKVRTMIAVSKFGHCLHDLLHKWQSGLLHTDIVGVISNHEDMRSIVEWYGLPYFHLPVTADTKPQQEAAIIDLMDKQGADLLVLARYMQILSEDLCRKLEGRCINIHHSFLPSFKGASPYKRAHQRGVKLVGATAHYVTSDLDEGPIIEQDVVRVTHATSAEEMTNLGKEVEARVLSRAVRWHVERRTIQNGARTIVFN